MSSRGYRAGGVRVPDPFTSGPSFRDHARGWAAPLMIVVGALLALGVTVAGNLGVVVPLLGRYPGVTVTVGLYLLMTGLFRLR